MRFVGIVRAAVVVDEAKVLRGGNSVAAEMLREVNIAGGHGNSTTGVEVTQLVWGQ